MPVSFQPGGSVMADRPGGRTSLRWGLEPASYQVTARPVGLYFGGREPGPTDRNLGTEPVTKRVRPGPRSSRASSQSQRAKRKNESVGTRGGRERDFRLRCLQEVSGSRSVDEKETVRRLDIGVQRGPREVGVRRNGGWVSDLAQRSAVKLVRVEELHLHRLVTRAMDRNPYPGSQATKSPRRDSAISHLATLISLRRWYSCAAVGVSLSLRSDIAWAATTMPSLWRWNGDEGVQKRERGSGCGDLALPSLDVAPRRSDNPQPDETEGQADEIDPEATAQEHPS